MSKVNLLDLSIDQLRQFFSSLGEKPFRATQMLKWVHQQGVTDFALMTNFGLKLRTRLAESAELSLPKLEKTHSSNDGTIKWLLKLKCGNCVETVYIPEAKRGTLCVSSQIGCGLNCSFCSTAKQGFNRDLNLSEIIGQLWFANQHLKTLDKDRKVTNVVMMGMGEPLLNYDNVVNAMDLMMNDNAYGLSKYRVTLSTSGLIPQMLKLKEQSPVALAVSLHAPNDALRNELVPVNKKYPLAQLLDVCKDYFANEPRRKVTFEYVMLDGVNDSLAHAKQLAKVLQNVPSKVNLIPFNPFPEAPYQRSSMRAIDQFRSYLMSQDINTITRKTRGEDIDAACGQLAGKFNDRTSRKRRWQEMVFVRKNDKIKNNIEQL